VVPWAQSVISKWTGFSRIAAAVLLPRRLLASAPAAPVAQCAAIARQASSIRLSKRTPMHGESCAALQRKIRLSNRTGANAVRYRDRRGTNCMNAAKNIAQTLKFPH
jgi:hypothetical protein